MNFSQALGYMKAYRRVRQGPIGHWVSLDRSEPPNFIWESEALGSEQWYPTAEALLAENWEVEAPQLLSRGILIGPQEPNSDPGDITFCVTGGVEVLRLKGNGDVFVRGILTDSDKRILKALKEFLASTPYGEALKIELVADGTIIEPRTRFERVLEDAD
jgi:hypothetical protein